MDLNDMVLALPSTPSEAKSLGSKTYFTGRPCRRGHLAVRFASNADCSECIAIHTRARTARSKATYAAKKDTIRSIRLAKRKARETAWRLANSERVQASYRSYYESNRTACINRASAWGKRNPAYGLASARRRQADKLNRTPPWADLIKIRAIYQEAKARGEGMHVDHVIPLRGRYVSGLHVAENLQILPAKENLTKSNRFQEQERF